MAHDHHDHEHDHPRRHEHDEHEHELTEAEARAEAERLIRRDVALAQIRSMATLSCACAPRRSTRWTTTPPITERMVGFMHDAEGVGLAATQVGILRRFFVCTLDGEDRVLVNPVVTAMGKETRRSERGASLGPIRVPVSAPRG